MEGGVDFGDFFFAVNVVVEFVQFPEEAFYDEWCFVKGASVSVEFPQSSQVQHISLVVE